jgi:hypothetical protein
MRMVELRSQLKSAELYLLRPHRRQSSGGLRLDQTGNEALLFLHQVLSLAAFFFPGAVRHMLRLNLQSLSLVPYASQAEVGAGIPFVHDLSPGRLDVLRLLKC